jgi:hypothetical protein
MGVDMRARMWLYLIIGVVVILATSVDYAVSGTSPPSATPSSAPSQAVPPLTIADARANLTP